MALLETKTSNPSGSSASITFDAVNPGESVTLEVWANATAPGFTPPDGFAIAVPEAGLSFRAGAAYYKVLAGGDGPTFTVTIGGSQSFALTGRRYSDTITGVGDKSLHLEPNTQNFVTTSITTTSGSIVSASGFSSLTEGTPKTWNVGWLNQVNPGTTNRFSAVQKTTTGGVETATMTAGADNNRLAVMAVEFLVGPAGAAIDTADEPILLGETGSHTVSNYSGPITSGSIGVLPATSVTDTAHTFPDLAHGLVVPAGGAGNVFELSDGTDIASLVRTLAKAGWTFTTTTAPVTFALKDWANGFTTPMVAGDGMWTNDTDTVATHNANGTTTPLTAGTSIMYAWLPDDGTITLVSTTFNSEGGVVGTPRRTLGIKLGIGI